PARPLSPARRRDHRARGPRARGRLAGPDRARLHRRSRAVTPRVWCLPLAAMLAAAPAAGQAPAVIAADAVVVSTGMTLTAVRDLAFGSVPRGVATTVQPVAANAGAWDVTGSSNAFVTIT